MKKIFMKRAREDDDPQPARIPPPPAAADHHRGQTSSKRTAAAEPASVPSAAASTGVKKNHHRGQTSSKKTAASRNSDLGFLDGEKDDDGEDQRPLIPIEAIKWLQKAAESGGGAVFLYRKWLVEDDMDENEDRLVVTEEKKVREFLRAEEVAAVDDSAGEGLNVVGEDGKRKYRMILIKKFGESLVIKNKWHKLVNDSYGGAGDLVEVWGFRKEGKPRLGFKFRLTES